MKHSTVSKQELPSTIKTPLRVRFEAWLDRSNQELDRKMRVQEYGEILISLFMNENKASGFHATEYVRNVKHADRDEFERRALDLFAYQERLTTGDGALSFETFQHNLYSNDPAVVRGVLAGAEQWSAVRDAHNAAEANLTHPAPVAGL